MRKIKKKELYGTHVDETEWVVDLKRKRLINLKNTKLIRELHKQEIKRILELIEKYKSKK